MFWFSVQPMSILACPDPVIWGLVASWQGTEADFIQHVHIFLCIYSSADESPAGHSLSSDPRFSFHVAGDRSERDLYSVYMYFYVFTVQQMNPLLVILCPVIRGLVSAWQGTEADWMQTIWRRKWLPPCHPETTGHSYLLMPCAARCLNPWNNPGSMCRCPCHWKH